MLKSMLRAWRLPVWLSLALGAMLAFGLPAFSGPDEMGHLAYVAAFAAGHLPEPAASSVADLATGRTWQSQHPPLFYALATPAFILAGPSPKAELRAVRLVSVLALAPIVLACWGISSEFVSRRLATALALGVGLHPTLTYIVSMANNEGWATAFALLLVWAALRRRAQPGKTLPREVWRQVILCGFLAGLCLLTKWTTVPIVFGSAWIAGGGGSRAQRMRVGAAIIVMAIVMWAPWGLVSWLRYGAVLPNPFPHAAFTAGPAGVLLYPVFSLRVVVLATCEFVTGFGSTYWLWQGSCGYSMIRSEGCGYTCSNCWGMELGAVLFLAALVGLASRHRALRFVPWMIGGIILVVVSQIFTRDISAVYFASRYTPIPIALAAMLVGAELRQRPPALTLAAAGLWSVWAGYALFRLCEFFPSAKT